MRRVAGILGVLATAWWGAPKWIVTVLSLVLGASVVGVGVLGWGWALLAFVLAFLAPAAWHLAKDKYDREQWDVELTVQPRHQGHGELVLGVRVTNRGPKSSFEVKVADDSLTGAGQGKPAAWGGFPLGWGGGGGRVALIARDDNAQVVFAILQSDTPQSRLVLNGADRYHETLVPDLPMYGVLEVRDTERDTPPKRWDFAVTGDDVGMKLRVDRKANAG